MKRLICVLLSVLLLAGCLASCSVTINHGDSSAETETQSETEISAETTTAKVNYAAPTDEEYNELLNLVFSQGNYDSAADNALPRAVFFALHYGGAYPRYAEKGRAFAPNELVESDTPDPRELFYDESEGNYQYWKTSADALDKFLREIMNVEPDHGLDVRFSDDGSSQEDEYNQVETYYEDGFYYTQFGLGGNGSFSRVIDHKQAADGWEQVVIGYYGDESETEPSAIQTVTAKIVEIDGVRYWSIKTIHWMSDENEG